MRPLLALAIALAGGCASAGEGLPGTDGGQADSAQPDMPCLDTDEDGVCNHLDQCPGNDDAVDTDADTVADGCDQCPMFDDRIDMNANMMPDCTELQTRTIDVKKDGDNYWRGWYHSGGSHTSVNDNTITGLNGTNNYNSYFVFSLAGFTPSSVASVTFELELQGFQGDANETISIWDVTTPTSTLEANASGTAALTTLNDLGSGMTYGTFNIVSTTPLDSVMTIPLNMQAATDLLAKAGQEFALGVKVDSTPGWVRFSQGAELRVARLIVRYF